MQMYRIYFLGKSIAKNMFEKYGDLDGGNYSADSTNFFLVGF